MQHQKNRSPLALSTNGRFPTKQISVMLAQLEDLCARFRMKTTPKVTFPPNNLAITIHVLHTAPPKSLSN